MTKRVPWPIVLALLTTCILLILSVNWAAGTESPGSSLALAMAFLFPLGLALVAWSALPSAQSERVAVLAPLALALALVGYLAFGFGFHFGGAAFISQDEGLQGLSRFFSLVRGDDSAGWGLIGLEGFFLRGDASTPAAMRLFVSQLPLVTTITLLVLLALPRRTPPPAQMLAGLIVSSLIYPLAGHWVSGGGWLAHLGHTLTLGHGLVDFAGAGTVFVLGGASALATSLVFGQRRTAPPPDGTIAMPTAQFPLLAGLGVLLAAVGWIALGLTRPPGVQMETTLNWSLTALNGLASLAGGTLAAQLYSWFSTGRFDPLMGPRGALAGLIAASAGAPFLPIWAALLSGAIAGLLLPLAIYAVDHILRLDDTTAAITTYGLAGFWGLLAVALFADGRWGQGWNDVAGLPGQGVSGLLVAAGFQADGGQLGAQVWGGIALILLGLLLPWGILKLFAGLFSLNLRLRRQASQHPDASVATPNLNPSGERQGAPGDLDRIVNVDDGD